MWTRRGQTTAEYAILAAVVIGALLAMQIYVKRGAMGRLRGSADQLGGQFTPLSTTSTFAESFTTNRNEQTLTSGEQTATADEAQSRTGGENVEAQLDHEQIF